MPRQIRNCIECRECHTRYVIGSSPYHNGSYLVSNISGLPNVIRLYCSCHFQMPQLVKTGELRVYAVSEWAHERGYGSPEEIVLLVENKRAG
jgi:hypothetical protein